MKKLRFYYITIVALCAMTASVFIATRLRQPGDNDQIEALLPCLKERTAAPIPMQLVALQNFTLPNNERVAIIKQTSYWCKRKSFDIGIRIHAARLLPLLRTYGDSHDFLDVKSMLQSLTDETTHTDFAFTLPLLYDTPYGVSYRISNVRVPGGDLMGGMTHVDKVLSVLGELGYDLTTPVVTFTGKRYCLADVLEDSMKRWRPGRESEWTLVAYCDYLLTQNSWRGGDGRVVTIDAVLAEVLTATSGPCAATHRLYGLARACARDRRTPGFFSPQYIREAKKALRQASSQLALSQFSDGSWDTQWNDSDRKPRIHNDENDLTGKLWITGHMLEWFAAADPDLRPTSATMNSAAQFVRGELVKNSNYHLMGPLLTGATHAVRGLLNLCDERTNTHSEDR